MNDPTRPDRLDLANAYEKAYPVKRRYKQLFHVCPPTGWLNDPNGFSLYRGEYHLFYQHNPYAPMWGSIHWGHCKTRDFIAWEDLPVAMAPDRPYDQGGCFSGGALDVDGRHVLVYTGISASGQAQCLAVGDGICYEKYDGNPVLAANALPEDADRSNFRDPKLWREGNGYYMLTGCGSRAGRGRLYLFRSDDLRSWAFASVFLEGDDVLGGGWECPDYFSLDGRKVLIVSLQRLRENGLASPGRHAVMAFLGETEGLRFAPRTRQIMDYGADFYAPQTLQTADGRRILIAWMNAWDRDLAPKGFPYRGMMTLPRELRIKDGRLLQRPVRELERYRCDGSAMDITLKADDERDLPGTSAHALDMTIELCFTNCRRFELELARSMNRRTALRYEPEAGLLSLEHIEAGGADAASRRVEVADPRGRLHLRVILDRYSAEIFVNHGQSVLTTVLYTPRAADGLRVRADGETAVRMEAYPLRFAWA